MNMPGPLVRVQAVEVLDGYRVRIQFKDGVEKQIDLEKYLRGEIFAPIRKDPNMFRSVRVVGGTIGWENGADIDPDVLYYDLRPAWMDEAVDARK